MVPSAGNGPAPPAAVAVCDVGKSYVRDGRRLRVLVDCSFSIEANRLTVLIGPSGSGKTTLVRLIAGYERADAGAILLNGKPVAGPGAERMVVFQETALFPWMTLIDNVAYGPIQAGMTPAAARAAAGWRRKDPITRVAAAGGAAHHRAQPASWRAFLRAAAARPQVLS